MKRPESKQELSGARPPEIWLGKDGTLLTLRPISPSDVRILESFVRGLSFGTRYFRFGRGDIKFTEDEFLRRCKPNPRKRVHFIVVKVENGAEVMVGSAQYFIQPDGESCEFTIAVGDAYTRRGVARRLMEALQESAASKGLKVMYAHILATNDRMIELGRRFGFEIAETAESPAIKKITKSLEQAVGASRAPTPDDHAKY